MNAIRNTANRTHFNMMLVTLANIALVHTTPDQVYVIPKGCINLAKGDLTCFVIEPVITTFEELVRSYRLERLVPSAIEHDSDFA